MLFFTFSSGILQNDSCEGWTWDRGHNSEVCHPRCAFKLYGEVNSVKKHNYKVWLNDGVY